MFCVFCVIFVLWFLRGLGARPEVIRVIFCAPKPLPTSLSNGYQRHVFNIINNFLVQTKNMFLIKPRAIPGVYTSSRIHYCGQIF